MVCGKTIRVFLDRKNLCGSPECSKKRKKQRERNKIVDGRIKRGLDAEGNRAKNRRMTKRRSYLENIMLWQNPFPKEIRIHWHHVNSVFIVPLPEITHEFIGGGAGNGAHWKYNAKMIKKIYCIDIEKLLK